MDQYHLVSETPLKFHKFFWHVTLPIGIIAHMGNIYNNYQEMDVLNWIYAIDYFFDLYAIVISIIILVGFPSWSIKAYNGVIILVILNTVKSIFIIVLYIIYQPEGMLEQIGQSLGVIIFSSLVWVYYSKRKALFIAP